MGEDTERDAKYVFVKRNDNQQGKLMDRAQLILGLPVCHGSAKKLLSLHVECSTCSSKETCGDTMEMDTLLQGLVGVPSEKNQFSFEQTPAKDPIDEMGTMGKILVPTLFKNLEGITVPQPHFAVVTVPSLGYSFPIPSDRKYLDCGTEDLKAALIDLVYHAFSHHRPTGYGTLRADLCAVHIELNKRQVIAPRFRAMPRLVKKPLSLDETDMALDRQVIDIHWRAFSQNKPIASIEKYIGIFRADDFDFHLAEKFCQEKWRPQVKVVHLHLSDEMQWEHSVLQRVGIRDKWRVIEFGDVRGDAVKQKGAPQIEILLREMMAGTPHLRPHIPGLVNVWKARRIVGDSPRQISRVVSSMTGEKPRDNSAIRKSLLTLDRCTVGLS
jgi:hypothetical protein